MYNLDYERSDYLLSQMKQWTEEMNFTPYDNDYPPTYSLIEFHFDPAPEETVSYAMSSNSIDNCANMVVSTTSSSIPTEPGSSDTSSIITPMPVDITEGLIPSSQESSYGSEADTLNENDPSSDYQFTDLSESLNNEDHSSSSLELTVNDDYDEPFVEEYHSGKSFRQRKMWTTEECNRLKQAVKLFGTENRWSDISKYVATRSVSQCVNKWNNDLGKSHKRWNKDDSKRLDCILQHTSNIKEIMKEMPDRTYIQIYQQLQKRICKSRGWNEQEEKQLIKMKKSGVTNAKICHSLSRNSDDIKNMIKKLQNRNRL